MRYEVQQYCVCGGWTNTWLVDEEPETFATKSEAQAAIDVFLSEIQADIEAGERDPDNGYSAEEFRVAPVTQGEAVA